MNMTEYDGQKIQQAIKMSSHLNPLTGDCSFRPGNSDSSSLRDVFWMFPELLCHRGPAAVEKWLVNTQVYSQEASGGEEQQMRRSEGG